MWTGEALEATPLYEPRTGSLLREGFAWKESVEEETAEAKMLLPRKRCRYDRALRSVTQSTASGLPAGRSCLPGPALPATRTRTKTNSCGITIRQAMKFIDINMMFSLSADH
jgi:hypothetical protein